MSQKFIVRGRYVTREKVNLAKEMRHKMTDAENLLWQNIRANRLDGWHFRRQQIINGYIVDFYFHKLDLIIEVDGEIHELQEKEDQDRELALKTQGFHVSRFQNAEILNQLPKVLEQIKTACKQLSNQPPYSPPLLGEGSGERSE